MSPLSRWMFLGVVLHMATLLPARAENLLANGEFDLDTLGWNETSPEGSMGWETIDHDGCGVLSGSAGMTNSAANTQYAFGAQSCATGIIPGQSYTLEAFLRFPTGQTAAGQAHLQLTWYDSVAGCGGGLVLPLLQSTNLTTATSGVWARRRIDGAVAPAGAHAARVSVTLQKNVQDDTLELRFDGVHLIAGAGFLFADRFEAGSSCRWSSESP